jgi:adenylosuccinate lyase
VEKTLLELAGRHKSCVMMGRTHEQHALPLTFGFVLAAWADEIRNHIERAKSSEQRWKIGCLTGGVGAQNAFVELAGRRQAQQLQRLVCTRLGLLVPVIDIHMRLDRYAEVVMNLAALLANLSRMALQLRTMERPEIAEIHQDYGPDACSSSTMPSKRNPEKLEHVAGLANLARNYAAAMLGIPVADHRDSARIPVERVAISGTFGAAARSLETIASYLKNMTVNARNMKSNLDHPHSLGLAASERLMIALYKKTGKKHWAHSRLSECAYLCRQTNRRLREVFLEQEDLAAVLSEDELDSLLDMQGYTGTAADQVEAVVARHMPLNEADRRVYGKGG